MMQHEQENNTHTKASAKMRVYNAKNGISSLVFLAAILTIPWLFALPRNYPWLDEGQFVDPAASLFYGHGFVSSVWPYQRPDELFMGNAPGYALVLAIWFQCVGFGIEQARSLNILLVFIGFAFLWVGCTRLFPTMRPWLKALSITSLFMGFGTTVSFWSARYDVLGFALVSILFWLWTNADTLKNRLLISGVSAAILICGFHLVFAIIFSFLILWWADKNFLGKRVAWVFGGFSVSGIIWLLVVAKHGLLKKFFIITLGSQHVASGQIFKAAKGSGILHAAKAKAFELALIFTQDPSYTLMLIAVSSLIVLQFKLHGETFRKLSYKEIKIGIGLSVILPACLMLVGKYPIYYSWIGSASIILFGAALVEKSSFWQGKLATGIFAGSIIGYIGLGVGVDCWNLADRESNAVADLERWTTEVLPSNEIVYSDFEAYFASRKKASLVFTSTYANTAIVPGIPEKEAITSVVINAKNLEKVTSAIGGDWQVASYYFAKPDIQYLMLKRKKFSGPLQQMSSVRQR